MISQHWHQVIANGSADCCYEEDTRKRKCKRKHKLSSEGRQEREQRWRKTEKSIYYYPSTTFFISIFLFQLVQHVHSWSSSSSLSSSLNRPLCASISSSTSTTTTIKNSFVRGDSLLSTTSASLKSSDHHHRYRMSSSLMLIQRHEKLRRRGKNVRIPSTDIKSSQSFRQHQQQPLLQARYQYRLLTNNIQQHNTNTNNPSMLLGDGFFFSMSNSNSATATTTSSSSSRNLSSSSSLSSWKSIINGGQKKNLLGKNQNQNQQRVKEREQRRGVLGFDLIESQSTSQRGTSSSSSSSSSSNESESYATTATASPLLPLPEPVLFPLIPTKAQIMSLKLKELKEACSQRGLIKVRNTGIL